MHLATGYENKRARIEIVPLIDVVFLLLVFFIYAMFSMSFHYGLQISLPGGLGTSEKNRIVITVTEDNSLWLNEQCVGMDQCVNQIAALSRAAPCSVMISGDRQADLGIGIELLSRLKHAGVQTVAFEVSDTGAAAPGGEQP